MGESYCISGNWDLIPCHMRGALDRYIGHGVPPGNFLTAVLCNDLREACGRADDINRVRLHDYLTFLYCDAPSDCWGSPAKFAAWVQRGGLNIQPPQPSDGDECDSYAEFRMDAADEESA
jgi:hypothetical protein